MNLLGAPGDDRAGFALRAANDAQKSGLRGAGRSDAGAGDRRKHGDVHRPPRRAAEAASLPRFRAAGAHLGRRHAVAVCRDARRRALLQRSGRIHLPGRPYALRRSGAGSAEKRPRLRQFPSDSRRRANAWPRISPGRGFARRAARGDDRRRTLAAALRGRSGDHRQNGGPRLHALHHRRRAPARLFISFSRRGRVADSALGMAAHGSAIPSDRARS